MNKYLLGLTLRFTVVMCVMILGVALMLCYEKVGNPDFYLKVMVIPFFMVAFFSVIGVSYITEEMMFPE